MKIKGFFLVCILFLSCKEKIKEHSKVKKITTIEPLIPINSKQPFLFSTKNELYLSWTQKINDSVHSVHFSSLNNGYWSKPIEIARGKNWFVNWADFPAIAVNKENILAHYLQKSDPRTFAYDVHLKLSNDKGKLWKDDFLLHTDSTKTEHGFVTLLPYKKDSFFVTWLDGRNTGGGSHDDEHNSHGAMNVRAARVLPTGEIIDDTLIDAKTCDCCQTSAAITPKGPVVVYRDRTDDEVRDIYISRLLDGSWTIPKPIHNDYWVINGCPVNGPKVASFNTALAVAWFTEADAIPKVSIVFSNDSGKSFDTPIEISSGKAIGRVDVAFLDEDNVLVSWMESTDAGAELKIIKVPREGKKFEPIVVAKMSSARASGFPQLEIVNGIVYMAWNHIEDKITTIKIKSFDVDDFND